MWSAIAVLLMTLSSSHADTPSTLFNRDQIIFTSGHNITKILVPVNGHRYVLVDDSEIPTIFFTIADQRLEGGTAIYALEGFAAYEILEGGRDTTADYSMDKTIYFAARDGLYKYDPESISAKRFGVFKDDFVQLQKENGTDVIYALDSMRKIYKIENNGTVKTRLDNIGCATEFVLDPSNNIYFVSCDDGMIHIVKANDNLFSLTPSGMDEHKEIKLVRPALFMKNYIPYIADGQLYILYDNGTTERKDFNIGTTPTALSIDSALYLVAAVDGKMYEFNVMDAMIHSVFNNDNKFQKDMTKIVLSIMDVNKAEGAFGSISNDFMFKK